MPLLAYDEKGSRVGYGKGFYDRFLDVAKPKKIIGLSFFEPEEDLIETDVHDVNLDVCIHPQGVVEF